MTLKEAIGVKVDVDIETGEKLTHSEVYGRAIKLLERKMYGRDETRKSKSLTERLIDAGYPREQIYHHESDLYVYVTPLTTRVIEKWCEDNNFDMAWHCPTFKDNITGKPMYDCAFQYTPQSLIPSLTELISGNMPQGKE